MRKNLLLVVLALFAFTANAQDYKPFQLYLGLGYAVPADGGGGILFDIEPAYRLNDNIAVGLRLESAAMAKVVGTTEASVSGVGSYTLNGKYYLGSSNFRPYVGVGLSLFALGQVSVDGAGATGNVEAGTTFGFYPRIGFDVGHFNINLDYNIVGSTQVEGGTGSGGDIKNSYIGIRIGGFFFGGQN